MAGEKMMRALRKEFSFLKKDALAVLLFGSAAKGEAGARDVDICIVAPGKKSAGIMKRVYHNVDVYGKGYDVYCFEELPLYLKWEVMDSHRVIWAEDEGSLYEYFYFFRKLQAEQRHRQEISREEILRMLHAQPRPAG
ncbi:MAG: nucleotidyltransferase domain-containing protein [Candidatus Micrarchaeota archaeon]